MADLDPQVGYWDAAAATKTFTHPVYWPWVAAYNRRTAVVIDYGCGYGRVTNEFVERGFGQIYGVDISPAMVARARREYPNGKFGVIGQPPRLFEVDAHTDLVLLFAVLTCVPEDSGQRTIIDELKRVLKPGGAIYISDLLLQEDARNRERYAKALPRFGTYGVFETDDGAVCRHHTREHLRALLDGFEIVADRDIMVPTMNGRQAHGVQLLVRRLAG
jgi:SAM-dependent methyltransferase